MGIPQLRSEVLQKSINGCGLWSEAVEFESCLCVSLGKILNFSARFLIFEMGIITSSKGFQSLILLRAYKWPDTGLTRVK